MSLQQRFHKNDLPSKLLQDSAPAQVIIAVLTDGDENASSKFTYLPKPGAGRGAKEDKKTISRRLFGDDGYRGRDVFSSRKAKKS